MRNTASTKNNEKNRLQAFVCVCRQERVYTHNDGRLSMFYSRQHNKKKEDCFNMTTSFVSSSSSYMHTGIWIISFGKFNKYQRRSHLVHMQAGMWWKHLSFCPRPKTWRKQNKKTRFLFFCMHFSSRTARCRSSPTIVSRQKNKNKIDETKMRMSTLSLVIASFAYEIAYTSI